MNEAVSDEGVRALWSLLSSEDDATERKYHDHAKTTTTDHKNKKARHGAHNKTTTTDHAKTTTTDHDAITITNTNAEQDIEMTQIVSLTTQTLFRMID